MSEFDNLKDKAEEYAQQHPEQVRKAEEAAERKLGLGQQDQQKPGQQGRYDPQDSGNYGQGGPQDQYGQGQDQDGQGSLDPDQGQDEYGEDKRSGY
jgi:hypothetical protein